MYATSSPEIGTHTLGDFWTAERLFNDDIPSYELYVSVAQGPTRFANLLDQE